MTLPDFSVFFDFFHDYFSTQYILAGIILGALVVAVGYLAFRTSRSSRVRSYSLLAMMVTSATVWTFVFSSFAFCMMMVQMYWSAPALAISAAADLAMVFTFVASPILIFALRRRAVREAYPLFIKNQIMANEFRATDSGRFDRTIDLFGGALKKATFSSGVGLSVLPSGYNDTLPASAAMDYKGEKIVAISEQVAELLDDEELEAVFAHELGHIKNRDSVQKTLATSYKFAFPFDPLARFIEAAIYREKELQADEFAAMTTLKPASLASALVKIYEDTGKSSINPSRGFPSVSLLSLSREHTGFLSKQPSLSLRVRRLLDLASRIEKAKSYSISGS